MIFSVENASFSYPRGREILRDLSFAASCGEVLAVLGPNGVGKTTLLKCMIGLQRWSRGMSFIDGKPITAMSARELFSYAAYVPQARSPSFPFRAEELVLMGRSVHIGTFGHPSQKDRAGAERIMEELCITHLYGRDCGRLSGGELQMLLIARALCQEPRILILDEPESNLDFRNQLIILETIRKLADRGLICIFNTHYPSHGFFIGNTALILSRNHHAVFGRVEEVLTETHIERVFGVAVDIVSHSNRLRDYTTVTALKIS